jgi:hypothetical protein
MVQDVHIAHSAPSLSKSSLAVRHPSIPLSLHLTIIYNNPVFHFSIYPYFHVQSCSDKSGLILSFEGKFLGYVVTTCVIILFEISAV